jgi:hypothetical protein
MQKLWTDIEMTILKNNYKIGSRQDICSLLPNRTWRAITNKARRLELVFHNDSLTFEEKFWSNVDKQNTDRCWHWTGFCYTGGYGQINMCGKMVLAHRFSYELHFGKIPKDKPYVLHMCDNPPCVNPHHLFLGTAKDNSDDMIAKGRDRKAKGKDHYMYKGE